MGGRLIQWLIEVELLETDYVFRSSLNNKPEQVSVLKATENLQKFIGKNDLLNFLLSYLW